MDQTSLSSQLALPSLLARRADDAAATTFLVDLQTGETLSYGACHDRVRHFAGLLAGLGVKPGDRVATMLPTSADEHCLWLACGWLRALQVPVNPAYRGHLLRHVLTDSEPAVLITASRFTAALEEVIGEVRTGQLVVWDDPNPDPARWASGVALRQEATAAGELQPPGGWDTAAVIYTSGTTGPAKGVLVPWGELASGIPAFDDLREGDHLYAPFAPFHLAGKLPLHLLAHWAGTFVFREGFKTSQFWADVRAHHCNRAWLFHAMAQFLWRQPEVPQDADNPLESVTGGPLMADYLGFAPRFGVKMGRTLGRNRGAGAVTP